MTVLRTTHTRSRGVGASRVRAEHQARPTPIREDAPHNPGWDIKDEEELVNALSPRGVRDHVADEVGEATYRVTMRKG